MAARKTVLLILLIVIVTNAVLLFVSKFSGPLIALVWYAITAYLCVYKNHFQAGIIAGIAGFSIHILEFTVHHRINFSVIENVLLSINVILPAALVYFSWKANKSQ